MVDAFPPTLSSIALAADNSTIAVTMSEAVFSTNGGSGALAANDFTLSLSGGTATVSATPSNISSSGNVYTLGLSFTGTPDGSEVVTVKPTASSIYDGAGNVANAKGINTSTYSLSFDGTDDYVVLDNSSSFSFDGDLSVSVWVKADDFDNNVAAVVDMHDGDNGYSIAKKTVVNQLSFVVGDGSDKVEVTTGTLSTGVWYHIVGTNDGTDSKIYVNGNLANSVAQGPVDASSSDLYIGKNFSGNETSFWDGNIDEVAVWNHSLSASEVAEIYNLGQGLDVSVGSGDYTSAANLKG